MPPSVESTLHFLSVLSIKEKIGIGLELIIITDLLNKYQQLAPIKPTQSTYEDVDVIIKQDYYHAVRPTNFIQGDDNKSPCFVRLPIGWVVSGLLPPSVESTLHFLSVSSIKEKIGIGLELIIIADLLDKYQQLAPIKPTQSTYEDVDVIIKQDYYHAVRPTNFI